MNGCGRQLLRTGALELIEPIQIDLFQIDLCLRQVAVKPASRTDDSGVLCGLADPK
jgi:hypothetical protein